MITQKPQSDHEIIKHLVNVIKEQAKLIDKLLENQRHLIQQIHSFSANDHSFSSSSPQKGKHACHYQFPFQQAKVEFQINDWRKKQNSIRKSKKSDKMQEKEYCESQMSEEIFREQSDQSDQSEYKQVKIPETKNVIKNFSKSLFRFMQRQRIYVSRVLEHLDIKQEEFQKVFQSFRGKIYTIVDLKQLWLEETNRFGKAFRIISLQYLRKNSLNHIFNSRVKNYRTHIKYRKKMSQILQNPRQFNSIKYD